MQNYQGKKSHTEAASRGVLYENMFFKFSQNSQENTCARVSFLIKLQALGLRPGTLLTKRLWHRYFPVNFVKFLRTPFLQNPSTRLLLLMVKRKTRVFVFAILVAKTMHDSSLAKRPFFSMHR